MIETKEDYRKKLSISEQEHKQLSQVVDICDSCKLEINDLVDGEMPCKNYNCPFFAIAMRWLEFRDAQIIQDIDLEKKKQDPNIKAHELKKIFCDLKKYWNFTNTELEQEDSSVYLGILENELHISNEDEEEAITCSVSRYRLQIIALKIIDAFIKKQEEQK